MSDRIETSRVPVGRWRYAIRDAGFSHTVHHVALALAVYMDGDGSNAIVSERRLAGDCSRNKDTVKRALVELINTGWLERHDRGPRRSPEHRSTMPLCPRQWGQPCPSHRGQDDRGAVPCAGCRCPRCEVPVSPAQGTYQQLPPNHQQKTGASRPSSWEGKHTGVLQ